MPFYFSRQAEIGHPGARADRKQERCPRDRQLMLTPSICNCATAGVSAQMGAVASRFRRRNSGRSDPENIRQVVYFLAHRLDRKAVDARSGEHRFCDDYAINQDTTLRTSSLQDRIIRKISTIMVDARCYRR
jgi:hypothetical protein